MNGGVFLDCPMISVIVPVYNVEKYLCECIDSICRQTYSNLEIILVDDGSPDGCPQICDEYAAKDLRIKVIHKENGGLSSARNAGLDIACGDYIGFVDSDDTVAADMYETLFRKISANCADICFCRILATTEGGEKLENNRFYGFGERVLDGSEVLDVLVKGGSTFYESAFNKLYRREVFSDLRYPEGKYHEDVFIAHRIFGSCGRIVFAEDASYFYRLRSNSIMRENFSVRRLDALDGFIDRINYCLMQGRPGTAAYALLQALGKTLEMWMHIPPEDKASKTRIRKQMREIRSLYRVVPRRALDLKNKGKLFCGVYLTVAYRMKLKMQMLCSQ